MDTDWRLFIAVPLPPEVVSFVREIIDDLRMDDWPIRWTNPENAHLTLHFLGDTPPEQAEVLRLALRGPIAQHDAFALRTANLGVFPKLKRPRVLWLGLYGPAHRLETLRSGIGEVLASLEYEVEARDFHPHITLGRLRATQNTRVRDLPEKIRARFDAAEATGQVTHHSPLPVPIDEVHLVRSHLTRESARYEVLERYPLRPADKD